MWQGLLFQVLTGPLCGVATDVASSSWTTAARCATSWPPGAPRITPEQAGLPVYGGGHRRVPGLRREELALLAGVRVDYLTRLERGNLSGASDSVLEALARALRLDEAERAHLFDLARAANATTAGPRRRPTPGRVRPTVQRVLDAITEAPAMVRNGRLDHLGTNRLGRALYAPLFDSPAGPPNSARFVFLDPRSPDFYGD